MPDLNQIKSNITTLRSKVMDDLYALIQMYGELGVSISSRFRDEYTKNSSSLTGMEDFYMLNNIVRKDTISAKNAHALIKRLRDISGYDIQEEETMDAELEKLLKD